MARLESSYFCDGCGVEITVAPYVQAEKIYCCKDCADGYECDCSAPVEMDDDRRQEGASQFLDATY